LMGSLCTKRKKKPRFFLFLLCHSSAPIGDEEAVGERLYSVERYLTKTQQLL
jgi:hypothetical protein